MINGTELYDISVDPAESRNLAREFPDRLADMNREYEAWWSAAAAERGFRIPATRLSARENPVLLKCGIATISPELSVKGEAGGRWIVWDSPKGYAQWAVEVDRPGTYSIALQMQCPAADAGSTVAVRLGSQERHATVMATPLCPRPEGILPIGEFTLSSGAQQISVRVPAMRALEALQLKGVLVTRIEPDAPDERSP